MEGVKFSYQFFIKESLILTLALALGLTSTLTFHLGLRFSS